MNQFGEIDLGRIKADHERIISVPRPQETVALGLVYSPLAKGVRFVGKEEPKPEIKPARQAGGAKSTQQPEVQAVGKQNTQLVHKESVRINTESAVWDESMRVLPVTPEEEFEFREVGGSYKLNWRSWSDEPERICQISEGYEVTGYNGKREKVSIPAYHRGKPVVAIKHIQLISSVRQVEIPGTCEIIGSMAFYGTVIPNWLKEDDVYSLVKIVFHQGLRIIDDSAFRDNIKLVSLNFPRGLVEIGAFAFEKCDFREIHIPSSVRRIGCGAFEGNRQLSSVYFPQDARIEKIDEKAFVKTDVRQIKLPAGCKCGKLLRKEKELLAPIQTLYKTPKPAEYISVLHYS